jgi:hypothetical protein
MSAPMPRKTGLVGPVVLLLGVLLLLASPIMRGGNRYVALIPLEFLALAVLLGLSMRWAIVRPRIETQGRRTHLLVSLLVCSPLLLALAQLAPVSGPLWAHLPGHDIYIETLKTVGGSADAARPISLGPTATATSLLAGIPIAAAFLLGYFAALSQLRILLGAAVTLAFAEVFLGLMQTAEGLYSPLFFGVQSFGVPVGSFANRNHFANYLAMALAA